MPEIRILAPSSLIIEQLADLLVETVANGGSVNFLHPYSRTNAVKFWQDAFAAAERNERVILGSFVGQELVSTVTLRLDTPPNQPFRAEIAKMMTLVAHRGKGHAKALLKEAEKIAVENGRTLLVLDTASDGGASGMYERVGYVLVGTIPDFAYKPRGGLTGTMIYYKKLA